MAKSDSDRKSAVPGQEKPDDEREQARNLVERDRPEDAPDTGTKAGGNDNDSVYRPEENVDAQKTHRNIEDTGHNTSGDTAPYSGGGQIPANEKARKDKIREESKKAESSRRDG